jgi:hypothetical protein
VPAIDIAFSPVRTLCSSAPHAAQKYGRPMSAAQPPTGCGASERRHSPSSVSEKRLSASSCSTPALASARRSRCSAPEWLSVASARSALERGPARSSSAERRRHVDRLRDWKPLARRRRAAEGDCSGGFIAGAYGSARRRLNSARITRTTAMNGSAALSL